MEYEESNEREHMREIARTMEDTHPSQFVSYCIFILTSLRWKNQQYRLLDADTQDEVTDSFFDLCGSLMNMLEDIGRSKLQVKDFDLFLYSQALVDTYLTQNEVKYQDKKVIEIYLLTLSAFFRLWMENFGAEDIINYFKGTSKREFPSLTNRYVNYKWAMEHNIPCYDFIALYEFADKSEVTAEEEIDAYKGMADMCKLFDEIRYSMIENPIANQDFIDSHLKTCREIFMTTLMLYASLPKKLNESQIDDAEAIDSYYKSYRNYFVGSKLHDELSEEENAEKYKYIFTFCFQAAIQLEKDRADIVGSSRSDLYKDLIERMSQEEK